MVAEIELSWAQVMIAAQAGCMRYVAVMRHGRRELDGQKEDLWEAHIWGALGELAVAQHLDLFWDPVWARLDRGRGDVGDIEVRTTTHPNGHLLLHERDRDEARFYFVRANKRLFTIVGSILGREGKRPEFWGDKFGTGRPCFWVPASALSSRDAATLRP